MAEYNVIVTWQRSSPDFDYKTFDRTHTWRFSGGQIVQGSAAPVYYGNPDLASPEAGLVAVLSSCQMLTFLAIAALKRFVVDRYEDHAEGMLGKNARGKTMVSQIVLRPKVVFGGENVPDSDTLQSMHRKAKDNCFIANSLLTEVILEPR